MIYSFLYLRVVPLRLDFLSYYLIFIVLNWVAKDYCQISTSPHLQSHFISPQLQSLVASTYRCLFSIQQQWHTLPVHKEALELAPAGKISSRVSHWQAWPGLISTKYVMKVPDWPFKEHCRSTKMSPPVFNIVSDRRGTYPIFIISLFSLPPQSSSPTVFSFCRLFYFYFPSYSPVRYIHIHLAFTHRCVSRVSALQEGVESCRKRKRKMPPSSVVHRLLVS